MRVHVVSLRTCVSVDECMFACVCVGMAYSSGGRYFPITALPVPHCSGKLFATLHD